MNDPDDKQGALPRRWPVWLALVAWAALLVLWHGRMRLPELSGATVGQWSTLTSWARTVAWGGLSQVLGFALLGLLAVFCLPPRTTWLGNTLLGRLLLRWLPAVLVSAALATLVLTLAQHRLPLSSLRGLSSLALAFAGCFVGAWAAMALSRGLFATILFVPQLLVLLATLTGGTAYLIGKAIAPSAAAITMPHVGSAERRHLYDVFASKNPLRDKTASQVTMQLSANDLNLLTAWALSLKGSPSRMALALEDDAVEVNAAIPIQGRAGFVNVSATGTAAYQPGDLSLHVSRLRLGRLQIPHALLEPLSTVLRELALGDARLRPLFAKLRRVEVKDKTLAVTFTSGALPPGSVARLFHDGDAVPLDVRAVRAYLDNLLANARQWPKGGEAHFGAAMQAAFRFAQQRSNPGHAVDENRAAVLALGIAIGHPDVERLIGDFLDDKTRAMLRAVFTGTTVRKRVDWPKHFFVSAALTLITGDKISDASGLLKEEKDAAGGSGFSFADLLADRAGTTFATVATRNEATARALQTRLGAGFHVDDYLPTPERLPEGIQDADFQRRYGGVGGSDYRRLESEIDRRVAACPAYRSP